MPDSNITKNALAGSMRHLMKEKQFEKISVIDICEGCGMNRKSFYYHFKDKYDLVNWIFYTEFIETAVTRSYNNGWDLLTAVVELFKSDREFYLRALEIEGQNSFKDYFFDATKPIFELFAADLFKDEDLQEVDAHYFSDAFLVIMHRWLKTSGEQSAEDFVRHLRKIIVGFGASIAHLEN